MRPPSPHDDCNPAQPEPDPESFDYPDDGLVPCDALSLAAQQLADEFTTRRVGYRGREYYLLDELPPGLVWSGDGDD